MSASPYVTRNSRAKQALGALVGLQQPTYGVMMPRLRWRSRLWRWCLRKAWRMIVRAARQANVWRRQLAPWYVATAVWLASAIASVVDKGWITVGAVGGLGTVAMWWWLGGWMWGFTRRRGLKPFGQRTWYGAFYAALYAWATVASAWTPLAPMAGILATITAVVWGAWMWHHRTRRADPVGLVPEIPLTEREQDWSEIKPVAGTKLINVVDLDSPKRWEADVDTTGTDLLVKDIRGAVPHIAKRFMKPATDIIVDYGAKRLEHLPHLTVVHDNPCDSAVTYDESWIPTEADIAEGCVPFHLYPNGQRGRMRLWLPGAGTVNTLFSGDIRTGKSAGMEAKMLQAVWTGKVWPMVGDPQGGVSMPTWCGSAGLARWQERDLDGIYAQLSAIREAMYVRSEMMAEYRWVDKWGDEQVGISAWDPAVMDWPAIGFALDEAHMLMKEDDFAILIREILKMFNKTGFYMDLATQFPGVEEFGNDTRVRQSITAGNLACYRNTSGSTKQMILPPHLPDPEHIPTETMTGDHTKGTMTCSSQAPRSSLPVYSRSVWAERARFWGTKAMERCPELDPAVAAVFAKYMPAARTARAEQSAAQQREQINVAAKTEQPVTAELARAGTVIDRVEAYLRGQARGWAHTGVIAEAIDAPLPSVSSALKRAEKASRVHQVRHGVWALGAKPQDGQGTLDEQAA